MSDERKKLIKWALAVGAGAVAVVGVSALVYIILHRKSRSGEPDDEGSAGEDGEVVGGGGGSEGSAAEPSPEKVSIQIHVDHPEVQYSVTFVDLPFCPPLNC